MSRSEARALARVDQAVASGVLGEREAALWRTTVADPCGCAEGLVVGVVTSAGATAARHGSLSEALASAAAGFAAGAVVGKLYGIARGLGLVRHQREALGHRLVELGSATTRSGGR